MKPDALLQSAGRQDGTVLLVALIMLLVMTMLGLSGMRGTLLNERMAGNSRDQMIALQAAEAALREAENQIAPGVSLPARSAFPCDEGESCEVFQFDSADPSTRNYLLSDADEDVAEWIASATEYSVDVTAAAEAPRYLITHRAYERDHLGTGHGSALETGRDMFEISARGVGQSPDSVRMLQSIYAKRYN